MADVTYEWILTEPRVSDGLVSEWQLSLEAKCGETTMSINETCLCPEADRKALSEWTVTEIQDLREGLRESKNWDIDLASLVGGAQPVDGWDNTTLTIGT
jgi:hypothetical protein